MRTLITLDQIQQILNTSNYLKRGSYGSAAIKIHKLIEQERKEAREWGIADELDALADHYCISDELVRKIEKLAKRVREGRDE